MMPFTSVISLDSLTLLVFYFAAIVYLIFSMIMYYHWNEYSPDNRVSKMTLVVYLITTLPFIIGLGLISLIII